MHFLHEKDLIGKELFKTYSESLVAIGKACANERDTLNGLLSETLADVSRGYLSEILLGAKETKGFFTFQQLAKSVIAVPEPPKMDHRLYFKKDRKPFAVVSAPYDAIRVKDMKKMVEWADKYGFDFDILPVLSHYFIGRTSTIVVTRRGSLT